MLLLDVAPLLVLHGCSQTVSNVLSECGNNIDAAIRRLGELRLSGLEVASAGGAAQASASATPAGKCATAESPAGVLLALPCSVNVRKGIKP